MSQRFTTPFGPHSTADDVIAGVDLSGRRAIVTGGGGGLGRETARALASAGAEVTIAVRNPATASDLRVAHLDLADLGSVAAFTRSWTGPLHILVDNAGVMATPEQRTPRGPRAPVRHQPPRPLRAHRRPPRRAPRGGDARVVVLSSVGHVNGPVRFDDLDFTRDPYDPWLAYAQSKTANILFAVEAAKRWAPDGIAVNALNPGRIWETGLGRHIVTPPPSFDPSGTTGVTEKNIAQGAATSVLLAASPLVAGVTGRYFEDCQEAEPFTPGVRRGVADYALDPDNARRLWELSTELTS